MLDRGLYISYINPYQYMVNRCNFSYKNFDCDIW